MTEYRAYFVNSEDRFVMTVGFLSDSDAEATEKAVTLVYVHDIELWSGPRFITRLEATRP
jgi:hypothetical protein